MTSSPSLPSAPLTSLGIATRGSPLARWQAQWVQAALQALPCFEDMFSTELVFVQTTGDRVTHRPLHEIGGKGLFAREIEQVLIRHEADLAVHSLKDLPVRQPPGLVLCAFMPRHEPSDACVLQQGKRGPQIFSKSDMKVWAQSKPLTLATGSLRRHGLLRAFQKELSHDLLLEPLRGNVDSRLRKLSNNTSWDGLILARAGLERLGVVDWDFPSLDPAWFIPSPAQGVVAVQCREDHPQRALFSKLDCARTREAVLWERAVLEALGADCTLPVGLWAKPPEIPGLSWTFYGGVWDLQGGEARIEITVKDPLSEETLSDRVVLCMEAFLKAGVNLILERLKLDPVVLGRL